MAKKAKKNAKKPLGSSTPLGDQQAMAFVRVGGIPTAAMADTGTKTSIIDFNFMRQGVISTPLNKTGTMNIAGRKLKGTLHQIEIQLLHAPKSCKTLVEAFVPDKGQTFRKGIIVGMDFLQGAKLRVDGETGEVYCPRDLKPKKPRNS